MRAKELRGVGGWLALLAHGLLWIGPLMGAGRINTNLLDVEHQYTALDGNSLWWDYKLATWLVFALGASVSAAAGWRLFRRQAPTSVYFAKAALWVAGPCLSLALQGLGPLVLGIPASAEYWSEAAPPVVGAFLSAIVWTLYLARSERVRNTYGLGFPIDGKAVASSTATRRFSISALWEPEKIQNEGVRRICKVINVTGLMWVALLVLIAITSRESGVTAFALIAAVLGYGLARTVTWVVAGFMKPKA
ncbi:DUF2569 family protein [Pandoraea sp. XJJ-1]|uniref:DUF2569 family protein n=1 Tax=Pandoraea sp. XJJ-1 TaxID=3002643 RepID=UPI00227E9BAC|nr:DUF2569 family protein [Pandoraea sp. XJJ-1]WAL82776.1 DUF2569 family protein [Pandoraea sp. XJJ-1]